MRYLLLPFTPRYGLLAIAILGAAALAWAAWAAPDLRLRLAAPLAVFVGLSVLGLRDLAQTKHSILRNCPIAAHLRFFFEEIRPEMRQYFFESDKEGEPFARDKRAMVYQRAKREPDKRPFGTQYNVYEPGYE